MTQTIDQQGIIGMFERDNMDYYNEQGGLEGFCEFLNTDLRNGISKSEEENHFAERIGKFGVNKLPDPPVKTWLQFFVHSFHDLTLQILLFAGVLSFIFAFLHEEIKFEEFIDPIAIFAAVLVVSGVTAQTNFEQQRTFLEINSVKNNYPVTVIRAGERLQIMSNDVLAGDVIEIKTGDRMAADCLFINGNNLSINNSSTTGETVPVKVNDKYPFLKSGGAVESGIATVLTIAVGPNSQAGVLMTMIQEIESKKPKSPLERKVEDLAQLMTYIAIVSGIGSLCIFLVVWAVDDGEWGNIFKRVMVAITIFLCCVPEGLPLAVTISLSFSIRQMMNDHNFVRRLSACETMGGATTICSDKTGTLTQNKMTVVKYYMDGNEYDGHPELESDVLSTFADAVSICSTASHTLKMDSEEIIFVGSSSECALLQMITNYGKDYQEIRENYPIVQLNEFTSARKRMSVIVRHQREYRVFYKGAPDLSLPRCSSYLSIHGDVLSLTEEKKNEIMESVSRFAEQSLRTLLIAYADVGLEEVPEFQDPEFSENNLVIIGLVGIMDPLRPEVPEAITKCQNAGVTVRMVTGDYLATAKAISRQCGILKNESDIAMEGKEFAAMTKIELLDKIDNLRVLARSSPTDKYRLVSLLMECGEVVAVTGDGSNDSAALKKASVGFAMGQCGTELAKIASDIVILDDNFRSIVSALKWGRCIYYNIQSFVQFQVPVNFVAVIVSIIGSVYFGESPLKPIQILWINLINDSLGALALATRKPNERLLQNQPNGENEPIVSNVLKRNIGLHTLYKSIILLLIMFGSKSLFQLDLVEDISSKDWRYKGVSSFIFNTFVLMTIANLLNSRVVGNEGSIFEEILDQPMFIIVMVGLVLLQIIIISIGGRPFYAVTPSLIEWVMAFLFALGDIAFGYAVRMIKVSDRSRQRLRAYKKLKKERVRKYYNGKSHEEQWNGDLTIIDYVEEVDSPAEPPKTQSTLSEIENAEIPQNPIVIDNSNIVPEPTIEQSLPEPKIEQSPPEPIIEPPNVPPTEEIVQDNIDSHENDTQ